ncbi:MULTISPECIES: hypothetical protein [Acidobacterium]|uniref:hypothetical protein n=1 Tax=Acidobacterium TaxID=33973 RepID=UPI0011D04490|nr:MULTISPECIES: hypothetical protein [Acidobacterium]
MARGWESKSVEEQMAEQAVSPVKPAVKDPARERKRRDLEMQREYILNQRTSHADRRAALEAALQQIEDQLKTLD